MSDNLAATKASTPSSEEFQVFKAQGARPTNKYLTELSDVDSDYCLMACALPPGAIVPLHSHADRETFYVTSGELEACNGDHWQTLRPGDVLDVVDGMKHAWRNVSRENASMLCVSTMTMGRFLRDISRPAENAAAEMERFLRLSDAHGYWLGSPEDNAAIGLSANWDRSGGH